MSGQLIRNLKNIFHPSRKNRAMCSFVEKKRESVLNENKSSSDRNYEDEKFVKRIVLNPKIPSLSNLNLSDLKPSDFIQYALLLSYCGKNYFGIQSQNNDIKFIFTKQTIEDYLLDALVAANMLSFRGRITPTHANYSRTSRTDKGVSAVRQIITIKLPCVITEKEMVKKINESLPDDIRVMDVVRCVTNFKPRDYCDSRTYSYTCPTFAFAPIDEITSKNFRISRQLLDEIEALFQNYVGIHRFHNFTNGVYFRSPKAYRSIRSIRLEEPFEKEGYQWVRILIHGNSFMIHQIRKMVGFIVTITRGLQNKEAFNYIFEDVKFDIPKAPPSGLLLEEQHFNSYNYRRKNEDLPLLDWSYLDDEVTQFRKKYIESVMLEKEVQENHMIDWLSDQYQYSYGMRENDDQLGIRNGIGRANCKISLENQEEFDI